MTELCGWKSKDCNSCPYMEMEPDIHCVFKEELKDFLEWMWLLFKESARMNPLPWGSSWRMYYGPKDVYEWVIYDFPYEKKNKFWELWRDGGKEAFKSLGFGIIKEPMVDWILFWEVKYLDKIVKLLDKNLDKYGHEVPETKPSRSKNNEVL